MSYGLIYTIPYASFRDEACVVEIEKENYEGNPFELIGADSPFEVKIDEEDFLYVPTRFSTATIRVVGSDYLQQLFSTSYQQYRVTFKRDGVVTWCGFIKPEVYTQDYSTDKFELEIECMSAMSVLEFINYKQEGSRGFVSFWELFKKCIEAARGQYTAVYIPHVYAKDAASYAAELNVFKEMTISEQNFFDEDDKPMKLKEVLEEMCKFLNWTCVDYLGELYFVDIDHTGAYHKYTPDLISYSKPPIAPVLNVQRIGFSGSDHSLDRLNGYNKVTVKTSNYCISEFDTEEDYEELSLAVVPPDFSKDNKVSHKKVYLPGKVGMKQYSPVYGEGRKKTGAELSPEYVKSNKNSANDILGAYPIRYCAYEMVKDGSSWIPNINDYNYTDAIQIRTKLPTDQATMSGYLSDVPAIEIKGENMLYAYGAFSLSFQYMFINKQDIGIEVGLKGFPQKSEFKGSLRIGKRWWNGTYFVESDNPIKFTIPEAGEKPGEWFSVKNQKKLNMPYDGMSGYIIDFGSDMFGDLELSIYAPDAVYLGAGVWLGYPWGLIVKDFEFKYKSMDSFSDKTKEDRYYENIINEDYINELDEIEFKISSYNNDGACYSKVLIGDKYLTNNLYSEVMKEPTRPEEQLIHRIVNRYGATHIKLTQVIKETTELTPLSKVSDNFMVGSIFMPIGGSIDYQTGQYRCIMVDV